MKKLFFRMRNDYIFINPIDIIIITRKNSKSIIFTVGDKNYVVNESLEKLGQRLDSNTFFRCHKGYIINVEMVIEFSPYGNKTYTVKLKDTSETALITLVKAKEFRQKYCTE